MSVTVANIITNLDSYIGDTSNDRISAAERLQFITEATVWLQEELGNDYLNASYDFDYFDTAHVYKITTAVPDVLETVDLRRSLTDQTPPFAKKSTQELYSEIAENFGESSYALERLDANWYLVVNHASKYAAKQISSFESLTIDGGTWAVDSTDSDATNLTVDTVEYNQGTGSLNFDVDVSQSANNRATIVNDDLNELDLSDYEDLASFLIDVWIPETTDFSSVTLYWGSDSSNYWSLTVTTDINSNSFTEAKWNTLKFAWASATATGSPDETAIDYIRIDFNYAAGYVDDTDFRIDNLRLVRPEKLKFVYTSWTVGTNTGGTDVYVFGATTDVPFFSGKYDQYKFAVAHKAAAIAFRSMRLKNEADEEDEEAEKALKRAAKLVPSSVMKEGKSFKVKGLNFSK